MACLSVFVAACSPSAYMAKLAERQVLGQPSFKTAHTGISIYDVATGRYLYNYQGEKYFVPASNTKIFTLYAGLKYVKDSLAAIRFEETPDTLFIYPTADPTLLHPDFEEQPLIKKLQNTSKKVVAVNDQWQEQALGPGWSWNDYSETYMVERSSMPVYGNVIKWIQSSQKTTQPELEDSMQTFIFSEPEVNWKVKFREDRLNKTFRVNRRKEENYFEISQGEEILKEQSVPFITNGIVSALELLKDTVHKEIVILPSPRKPYSPLQTLRSQSSDSLYKPMMHLSDNFFAEHVLLMASYEKLGIMSDSRMIDTLLNSDLAALPQRPRWVDGSGLSRYNLFTPQDFVWILNRIKEEFGMERVKAIFSHGGQGTLKNYYAADSAFIYAKTGTLSSHIALSGYLLTAKNKLLIFSVLVNNHQADATAIRRAVEQFLLGIRKKY